MGRLHEKQIAAIAFLSRPKRGGLTYEQIANEVGVDKATLYRWRTDDEAFAAELKRVITRTTLSRMPDIMESIPDHIIKDGNAAMLRTFLQMHGMLTEKVEVEAKDGGVDIDSIREKLRADAERESKED